MLKVLGGFHHWADRRITGMTAKRLEDREWKYSLVVVALEATGLHPIKECIRRRQATKEEQVACHPIYELCIKAERRPGTSRMMR